MDRMFVREKTDDSLSAELEHIISWSSRNGLHFNNKKSKVMNIITKRSLSFAPLIDNHSNAAIQEVSSTRLLGITIDSKLSWQYHLVTTLSKIRRRLFLLRTLKHICAPQDVRWTVYCLMIRSIASYSFPVWCNITKSRFQQLTLFENR